MKNPEERKITSYEFFKELTKLPTIEKILLFGSRAKGVHSSRADIDIAIDCPKATDRDWDNILDIIEDADTLLSIDCVRYDKIQNQKFKNAIQENHQVLFDRSPHS